MRLWSTKSGGQKAYCIRVSDSAGKNVRRTFDHHDSIEFRLKIHFDNRMPELGELLDDARRWAIKERKSARRRLTLGQETVLQRDEANRHRKAVARVKRLSLGRAAESMLLGMYANGRSQNYIDRIDKLFAKHIPAKLKNTPLAKVSPRAMADALTNKAIPTGNVRILRAFIGQIFERAFSFYGPFGLFSNKFNKEFSRLWDVRRDVRFPELRKWEDADYQRLFQQLEVVSNSWQQAICIRLFFEFSAPLTRVMAAQWSQLVDGSWYPYWPGQRRYWYPARQGIEEKADELLKHAASLVKRDFGSSSYIFPSAASGGSDHIKTVATAWRRALDMIGSRYYPIREFARSYRNPNNPSYYISLLRQYEPMINKAQKVDMRAEQLKARQSTFIGPEEYLQ